jgi:hypothetical protein
MDSKYPSERSRRSGDVKAIHLPLHVSYHHPKLNLHLNTSHVWDISSWFKKVIFTLGKSSTNSDFDPGRLVLLKYNFFKWVYTQYTENVTSFWDYGVGKAYAQSIDVSSRQSSSGENKFDDTDSILDSDVRRKLSIKNKCSTLTNQYVTVSHWARLVFL